MRVVITGATGFVGRRLVAALVADGWTVRAVSRGIGRARDLLGADVEVVGLPARAEGWIELVEGADVVVHLAGESVGGRRWTDDVKRRLRSSRIDMAHAIVDAIGAATRPPSTFVCASAVGYYGDRGTEPVTEDAAPGDDFLAQLCVDWEAAARRAESFGVRVVLPRLGLVLGRDGGVLERLLPVFRAGGGGKLGSGRQLMAWIHIDDLVRLLVKAMTDASWSGPINATAPHPVDNATFTRALGRAVGRPTVVPVPGFALKILFGEGAAPLLTGQDARPQAALDLGFTFDLPTIDGALATL